MSYGDVNITVEDGNLGRSNGAAGTGTHIKIGASPVKSSVPIKVTGRMDAGRIKALLGLSPLADACIDSVEWGADSIYNIPIAASTQGTISTVAKDGSGSGTVEVTGEPNNAYDIVVKIVDAGENNTASYALSMDGGSTFADDVTIPLNGSVSLADAGLDLKFKEGTDGNSWASGCTYRFSTTAPAMSNEAVIAAVEGLVNSNLSFEFVHIVGPSIKALWAALAVLTKKYETTYKRPFFVLCETRLPNAGETAAQYSAAMLEARKGINNYDVQVCCACSRYIRMDGREQDINNAGIVAGLYAAARESQSIGEVRSFPVSEAKMLKLLPDDIEAYVPDLDAGKFLTFRKYIGKEDFYVTSANMMAPDNSDFKTAEDVRVMNRLIKAVRAQLLDEMQVEIDPENLEADVAAIEKQGEVAIDAAVSDGIISGGSVTIDTEGLNILSDEKLPVRVTWVPLGHLREINVTFAMENPYTDSES